MAFATALFSRRERQGEMKMALEHTIWEHPPNHEISTHGFAFGGTGA